MRHTGLGSVASPPRVIGPDPVGSASREPALEGGATEVGLRALARGAHFLRLDAGANPTCKRRTADPYLRPTAAVLTPACCTRKSLWSAFQ